MGCVPHLKLKFVLLGELGWTQISFLYHKNDSREPGPWFFSHETRSTERTDYIVQLMAVR
jgi:hypothetical protein